MNNLTGKDNSLEELIAENQPRLKAFIRKRVSTKEDAEDILQDVLYQLVKTIESTFNPIEQVTAWLYRVARNTIINKGKKMQEEELPVSSYDKEDNVLSEFSEVLFSDAPPTPECGHSFGKSLKQLLPSYHPNNGKHSNYWKWKDCQPKKLPVPPEYQSTLYYHENIMPSFTFANG